MIPLRMYQDERQLAWGNINISQNQAFIAESGFDPPTSGLWAPARFLCATLLNESRIYVITNDEILIFIYIVFAFNKQKLPSCEGSNSRPSDYETDALPTALTRLLF